MDPHALSAAAYSAFTTWLLKVRDVPIAHRGLLLGGCPAAELPGLLRELKRVRTDFKRRPNEVSAPLYEPLRQAYAALGVPWSAWSEVEKGVRRDLQRKRYARWSGADALDFPEGPPYTDLVVALLFGGGEQVRPHLLRRASLAAGALEGLWCRWLAGESLEPEVLKAFAGAPEQLAEPLYDPGLAEVLPLFFVEPDPALAGRALEVVSAQDTAPRLAPLRAFLRALVGLWRQDTSLDEVQARFEAWIAVLPPSAAGELVAPAYLLGRYVEALAPHTLLEHIGSRLQRLPVPEKVADVQPVMAVLTALEELAARGQGLRVERRPGQVLLSAEEPVAGAADELL